MSRTISVLARYVEIDVDMSEIDTKDLVAELAARNAGGFDVPADSETMLPRLHTALKLGNDNEALQLARAFVCVALGVIL